MPNKEYLDEVDRYVKEMIEYNNISKLKKVETFNFFRNVFNIEFATSMALLEIFCFTFKAIGSILLFVICPFIDVYEIIKRIPNSIRSEVITYYIRRNKTYIEWKNNNG